MVIPTNADEFISLGEDIVAKHTADGVDSPLNGLDMASFATTVTDAKAQNDLQKQLRRDAEMATENRDGLLGRRKDQNVNTEGTGLNIIARVRDILLGIHKGNEQQLGQWGFEVNQSTTGGGDAGGTPTPSTGSLSSKVTDSVSTNVISNALVEVVGTGLSTTTDINGDFLLSDIPTGDRVIRISAPGYETVEGPYTINEGSNAVPSITLNPMS